MPTLPLLTWVKLGLAALVICICGFLYVQNSSLRAKVAEAQGLVAQLKADLKVQNDAVESLKAAAVARKQAGDALVADAQRTAAEAIKKAQVIQAAKPSKPNDDCASALDLGNALSLGNVK